MNSSLLSLVLCATLAPLGFAEPSADPMAQDAPSQALVLLKNGRILSGQVLQQGDRYQITLSNGEISLRAAEVTAVCQSLEEAYDRQLAGGKPSDIDHRMRTALWCVDQSLFQQAQSEIEAAKALDPSDRRLAYVERRLQLSQAPKLESKPAAPVSQPVQSEVVSHDKLEALVRNLPKGTPEQFAEVVQPLLLSRCGTSNCHGLAANQPLRLLRPPSNKSQASRITQRNLHAVLQFIDHEHPEQSQLIKAAGNPHAGNPLPLMNESQHAHLTQLAEWVASVTETQPPAQQVQPATISFSRPDQRGESQLNQIQRPAVRRGWNNPVQQAGFIDGPAQQFGDAGDVRVIDNEPRRLNAKGPHRRLPVPVDDLDPSQFNQRYFPTAAGEPGALPATGREQTPP